jgi:hypothetical protein
MCIWLFCLLFLSFLPSVQAHSHRDVRKIEGRQNKGWKGLILERLAGLENSNAKAPNGLSFELKSVSFRYVKGELVPKETMAITMADATGAFTERLAA